MLLDATRLNLNQLINLLHQLTETEFTSKLEILNQSSIGMHVRHIVEFYQCLEFAQQSGVVNYDGRKRDHALENSKTICLEALKNILHFLEVNKTDRSLELHCDYSKEDDEMGLLKISTSLLRELQYNLEHAVHHMAIIRIGINALDTAVTLDNSFGVASSTIRNKRVCAQ
ncbi:hypothetical protein ACJD0Z_12520 [Flavobacteriaceae bacterium M23B6Z8]